MPSAPTVSELLGYTSIACWLGAQFPQVLENIKRQSCEGLALPFLANWLLGNATCCPRFTVHTYLATYFVCVDLTLVAQYFYYTGLAKPTPSFAHPRPLPSVSRTRRISIERGASRYRTLSAVAANVAATAALAAQQDEHPDHRRRWQARNHTADQLIYDSSSRLGSAHDLAGGDPDDNDIDENALAALADSFHSEAGYDRKKRVSWSIERYRGRSGSLGVVSGVMTTPLHAAQPLPSSDSIFSPGGRERTVEREDPDEIDAEVVSPNRRSSKASRSRATTVVFLSTWVLFGVGTLAGGRRGFATTSDSGAGKVLAVRGFGMADSMALHVSTAGVAGLNLETLHEGRLFDSETTARVDLPLYEAIMTEPLNERIIGRIFAWLCTTLYLTSRLPQIWKNFVRKSVAGLSMYLFVFAFLGNVFYVASILSSPNMRLPPVESAAFINESIPYLLGSAGTLLFDVTIVGQSLVYRPRHKRHAVYSRVDEEETGLLTGDSVARHGELPRGRSSLFARDSTVRHLDADGDELATSSKDLSPELRQVKLRERTSLPTRRLHFPDLHAEIRHQILSGRVDEATANLNEHFPSVLSGPLTPRPASSSDGRRISDAIPYAPLTSVDPADLTLNLRILSFIEACRTIPLPYVPPHSKGNDRSSEPQDTPTLPQEELPSFHDDAPQDDEAEDEHSNGDHKTEDPLKKQLALLSKAQKLLALANNVENPATRDTFLKELNHVGGLLAYKVPEHSSISRYLSQERREAYADQINHRMGLSSVSNIELLARYTSTVWLFAHHCGVKVRPGVLIPPTSDSDSDTPTVHKEPETVPEFDLRDFLDSKT
ncbi:hypothetical protein DXG03_000775 [Asterophora parasitica]|uniref:CRA domain-containing protein n=1 Tax=Asterophora parasitica TaxID=117018 RepID=A0A9P7GDA0_9AGAR|nr:hypothetical protein DXG03_000775 [Asterophora parasitica]